MMMAQRAELSKAELEIARIVWRIGEETKNAVSVRQVLDALPALRNLDYKTVQTYLRRLEAKGYLSTKPDGKRILYRASVRPAKVMSETIRDFVSRLFDGDALPLVEHLINDRNLTGEEITKLREMLDNLDESASPKKKGK